MSRSSYPLNISVPTAPFWFSPSRLSSVISAQRKALLSSVMPGVVKAQGFRIGILTNMCSDFAKLFRRHFADFIELSDATVISGEAKTFKPEKEIYDLLRERIGLEAGELCFFDDVEANCQGARDAGWQAIRFASNDQAERDFASMSAI